MPKGTQLVLEVDKRQLSSGRGADTQSVSSFYHFTLSKLYFNFYYVIWVLELRKNFRIIPYYMLLGEVTKLLS